MPDSSQMWDKTKTNSKAGFDKAWGWLDKLGRPVNRLSNKLGSEAFWPMTLDRESEKAARILKSFCKDGFYVEDPDRLPADEGGPKGKSRVLRKIPTDVIKNAKGLCIFTTMRTGFWAAASGGAGILVARMDNGEWSPPSGIMMHTAGIGFLIGVDIYDCVIVINTEKALEAFTKLRCTLGGELSATAGPVGAGGIMDSEVHKRQAPIFTYLKGRGFYAGVQIDGTIILERWDENERFYNQKVPVQDILKGKVRHAPYETRVLTETLKAAEGQIVDDSLLPEGPTPGDFLLEDDGHVFGVPDLSDPDPYGVLALQQEGMEIREAGTRELPKHEEFNFHPSPLSPLQNIMKRRSVDGKEPSGVNSRRSSWRTSALSTASRMTDTGTQTDEEDGAQPSPRSATFGNHLSPNGNSPISAARPKSVPPTPPPLPPRQSMDSPLHTQTRLRDGEDDADDEDGDDAAVISDVQTASFPPASPAGAVQINKPRLVTVHKVAPPKLPPRSAARDRRVEDELEVDAAAEILPPASPTSSSGVELKAEGSPEAGTRPESFSSFSDERVFPEGSVEEPKVKTHEEFRDIEEEKDTWLNESAQTPKAEKPAVDGFGEVALNNPTPNQKLPKVSTEASRESSDAVRNFAAQMRLGNDDDDDDDDDGDEKGPKRTPGT